MKKGDCLLRVDRRRFLATGGAAAVAALLGRQSTAAPDRWRMKLSTSTIQFSSLPIEQACERIAGLGFEGIDIW